MNYQGSTNKISATNAFSRCYIVDKEQLLLQQTLPRGSSVMKQNSHESKKHDLLSAGRVEWWACSIYGIHLSGTTSEGNTSRDPAGKACSAT